MHFLTIEVGISSHPALEFFNVEMTCSTSSQDTLKITIVLLILSTYDNVFLVDVIFSVNRRPFDTTKLLNSLAMSVVSVIVLLLTYNDNLYADVLLFLPIMDFITLHEFDKLSLWGSSWSLKYFISAFFSADLSRFFFIL